MQVHVVSEIDGGIIVTQQVFVNPDNDELSRLEAEAFIADYLREMLPGEQWLRQGATDDDKFTMGNYTKEEVLSLGYADLRDLFAYAYDIDWDYNYDVHNFPDFEVIHA